MVVVGYGLHIQREDGAIFIEWVTMPMPGSVTSGELIPSPRKRDPIRVAPVACIPTVSSLGIDQFQASSKTQCGTNVIDLTPCLCDRGRNLGICWHDEWVFSMENHSIFGASPPDPQASPRLLLLRGILTFLLGTLKRHFSVVDYIIAVGPLNVDGTHDEARL